MDVYEAIGALRFLEKKFGRTPSVAEIAEQCNTSTSTALNYLDQAVENGFIVKRDGKFLSHTVANAYGQKE
jgi:DNA-binding IclR family transcriptional regulator